MDRGFSCVFFNDNNQPSHIPLTKNLLECQEDRNTFDPVSKRCDRNVPVPLPGITQTPSAEWSLLPLGESSSPAERVHTASK